MIANSYQNQYMLQSLLQQATNKKNENNNRTRPFQKL